MIRRTTLTAAVGAIAALLLQPWILAKPGAVVTSDGSTFIGDVDESAPGKVIVKDGKGPGIEINKANVKTTTYFATPQDEYTARMAALTPTDVKGRLDVAKWAINNDQPALARQAAEAALKLDPGNAEAKGLIQTLDAQKPATPAPTEKMPDDPAAAKGPSRLVTKDEINRIRQLEWQPNEDAVRVSIDKETKATFLARSRDMKPQDFNRMTPAQQAREILRSGTPKLRDGVHLNSDPASMANYRKTVQKTVVQGCAAAGCHDAASTTNFALHTEPSDEAAYTNFLLLQNYRTTVDGTQRLMIDRDQPNDSLLSQYMLAPKVADTPHPKVENYTGMFRSVQDPRFKLLTQWLRSMPTIPPNYGIDLTKPPADPNAPAADEPLQTEPEAEKGGAAPAAPGGEKKMEK